MKTKDMVEIKTLNLLNEYVTASFMATNANFNSAMVFETQLDRNPVTLTSEVNQSSNVEE